MVCDMSDDFEQLSRSRDTLLGLFPLMSVVVTEDIVLQQLISMLSKVRLQLARSSVRWASESIDRTAYGSPPALRTRFTYFAQCALRNETECTFTYVALIAIVRQIATQGTRLLLNYFPAHILRRTSCKDSGCLSHS